MPIDLTSRLKNAWNAFTNNKDPTESIGYHDGFSYSVRPDRPRFNRGAERSIVNAVYNRIAMDVAAISICHVRLDESERYLETIKSRLNECLSVEANIDQTGRSFIQDIVMSMFDEGCVAVVPVDTEKNQNTGPMGDIYSARTGKILAWRPESVRVRLYNEQTGKYEEIEVLKRNTLIIENPLYTVINEPNSTMQRLIRKLAMLDSVDEQSSSGKLDLIIQLPYTVRSELRKQQARERKSEIEQQLANTKYGIAYIDSTEHITQLNRAVENNLMSQIEYLTNMVYSQLGITAEILNGTADEKTMLNYNSRTIEPILSAITDEMKRKWLTRTSRAQGQSIMFFRQPFKLVPASSLAELADKFTRNEIMSSNEFRQILGMKKSDDPGADQLRNKNLNQSAEEIKQQLPSDGEAEDFDAGSQVQGDYDEALSELDSLDTQIDNLERKLDSDQIKHGLSDDDMFGLAEANDFDDWLAHYASPYYDPVKAHEYYMEHRKLVGRKSTAGLNDEGKEIAAYIKQNLDNERKSKVESNRSSMNTQISSSKSATDQTVKSLTENRSEKISLSKEEMTKKISRFRELTASIKESHAATMQNRIKDLASQISSKGRSSESKERIREKIAKLREENSKKRDELTQNFNNLKSKEQGRHTSLSEKVREDTTKQTNDAREKHRSLTSKLRSENKETASNLKQEYDEKYVNELDKLKSSGKHNKESKKKSDSSSTASASRRKVGYFEYQKNKK